MSGNGAATVGPTLRIAMDQGPRHAGSVERNLERLAGVARTAAEARAELLVCPEMSLTGYHIGDDTARLAEPADGPSARRVAEIAARTGVAILYGYPERAGERVHNAAQLVSATGRRLCGYRKTHLFGDLDRAVFSPGETALTQATLNGIRLGVLICYDVEFPEPVRLHGLAGTRLLLVPTALMHPHGRVARVLVPARAYENHLHIAYVNRCGTEGELDYVGMSRLVGPDGSEVARAGDGEELCVADVAPALDSAARREVDYLADRRPELYGGLTTAER